MSDKAHSTAAHSTPAHSPPFVEIARSDWAALAPTVTQLQDSAFDLLDRILDGYEVAP